MNAEQLEAMRILAATAAGGVTAMAVFLAFHWGRLWRKSHNRFAVAPMVVNVAIVCSMIAIVAVRVLLAASRMPLGFGDVSVWVTITAFAVAEAVQFYNLSAGMEFYESLNGRDSP